MQELMEVSADYPNALSHHSNGKYYIRIMDWKARNQKKAMEDGSSSPAKKPPVPPSLICKICDGILKDAVYTTCCRVSFCHDCVTTALMATDDRECPNNSCRESGLSVLNSIVPKISVRDEVADFLSSTSARGVSSALASPNINTEEPPVVQKVRIGLNPTIVQKTPEQQRQLGNVHVQLGKVLSSVLQTDSASTSTVTLLEPSDKLRPSVSPPAQAAPNPAIHQNTTVSQLPMAQQTNILSQQTQTMGSFLPPQQFNPLQLAPPGTVNTFIPHMIPGCQQLIQRPLIQAPVYTNNEIGGGFAVPYLNIYGHGQQQPVHDEWSQFLAKKDHERNIRDSRRYLLSRDIRDHRFRGNPRGRVRDERDRVRDRRHRRDESSDAFDSDSGQENHKRRETDKVKNKDRNSRKEKDDRRISKRHVDKNEKKEKRLRAEKSNKKMAEKPEKSGEKTDKQTERERDCERDRKRTLPGPESSSDTEQIGTKKRRDEERPESRDDEDLIDAQLREAEEYQKDGFEMYEDSHDSGDREKSAVVMESADQDNGRDASEPAEIEPVERIESGYIVEVEEKNKGMPKELSTKVDDSPSHSDDKIGKKKKHKKEKKLKKDKRRDKGNVSDVESHGKKKNKKEKHVKSGRDSSKRKDQETNDQQKKKRSPARRVVNEMEATMERRAIKEEQIRTSTASEKPGKEISDTHGKPVKEKEFTNSHAVVTSQINKDAVQEKVSDTEKSRPRKVQISMSSSSLFEELKRNKRTPIVFNLSKK